MKIILHTKGTTQDVTTDVLGELIVLPHHFLRRSEVLSLVSSRLGIEAKHICAWTDYILQPGFVSHINPMTPVSKQISSLIPTPNESEEILAEQEALLRTIPGDYKNTHISRLNWMVDPRIQELHIASFEESMEQVGENREAYLTRVYPWCFGANSLSLEDILRGESPKDIAIENAEIVIERLTRTIPRFTKDERYDPTITLVKCEFRTSKIDSTNGTTDHLGFPTTDPFNPYADYPVELNIGAMFQSLGIGNRENVCHAIAYCDPKQPTNSKIRIATTDDRDGTILRSVLSKRMIQYFRAPLIRRTNIQVPYDEPKEPYLRIVYSTRGVLEGIPEIPESLLSEAIVYPNGSVFSVIINPVDRENLMIHTRILESITGTRLRPITKEITFQLETGKIFDDSFTDEEKRSFLESRLLQDDTISKPIEADDPFTDIFRMRYNRVNLPETLTLTNVFDRETIRKMTTIMILANVEASEIISQFEAKKVSPGKVLEGIGLLPPDKEASDYRTYMRQNRSILRQALDIFASEMNREREEKELERVRMEEGSEDMAPDIQFRDDRKGGLTIFGFGCPNIKVTDTLIQYVMNGLVGDDTPSLTRPSTAAAAAPAAASVLAEDTTPPPPAPSPTRTPPAPVPAAIEEDLDLDLGKEASPPTPAPAPTPALAPTPSPPAPAPAAIEEDLDLDLGLDEEASPPTPARAPTPALARAPIASQEEEEDEDSGFDLGLDEEASPPTPARAPTPPAPAVNEEEEDDNGFDLGLGGDESVPSSPPPPPAPAMEEDDELELDIGDDESPSPNPPPAPQRTPSVPENNEQSGVNGSANTMSSLESGSSAGSQESVAFGRNQIGRGRVIGDDTLYLQGYPINRLRNKPLTEADSKAKRTRYAQTSAFRDIYEKDIFGDRYARFCRKGLQPIMITQEEYERFQEERPGTFGYMNAMNPERNAPIASDDPSVLREHYRELQTEDDKDLWGVPYKGAWFVCPKYWSMSEEIPLYGEEVRDQDIFDSRLKASEKQKNRGKDVYLSYDYATEPPAEDRNVSRLNFPGYRKDGKPCCFKVTQPKPGEDFEKYKKKILKKIRKQQIPKDDIGGASAAGATAPSTRRVPKRATKPSPTQLVQEDLRWNSSKDYLLPSTDVLDLIAMTGFQDRCNDMLKKYTKGLESVCVVRKPDPVNYYYDSLFRSILSIYHFTRGAMGKESNLKTPQELAESIVRFVGAEQFRTLQGGSLMRLFLPNDDEIQEYLDTKPDSFLQEWVDQNILPEEFQERFTMELEEDEPSDFLIRWAISHTRFKEHTLNDREPKSLNVYWEILTKHPWNLLHEEFGGRSPLQSGVNLFVIEQSDPPFLVCPPEGRVTDYFQERRPMAIIVRNEMVYQPMILMTRNDTPQNKRTKTTHSVQGLIYSDTTHLKERSPEMLALIRDLWKSVRVLPNHMRKQCAPESINPYSNTPTYEEVIETIQTIAGYEPNALVMDSLGRITGVSYPITPPTPAGVSAASWEVGKRIIIPTKPMSQDILPGLPIISGSTETASYREIKGWIQDLVAINPDSDTKLIQGLKKLRPVIKKNIDSFSVTGIQINDGLIAPVSDLERYTPGTIPKEFENAIISGWTSDTDDLLSMQPTGMKRVRNMIQESVRTTIRNAMDHPEFVRQLAPIRTDYSVPKHDRIQGIYDILEGIDGIVHIPRNVKERDIPRIKQGILERVAIVLLSPLLTDQALKEIVTSHKIYFPDTADREIHLTYQDLHNLRESMLMILQSSYIKGTETFAIGGASDPNYISSSSRNTPVPIRNLWSDKLHFNVNTSIAIRSRDGIMSIRMYHMGNRPRDSWDAIAVSMRDHMRDPNFNGSDLRERLVDIWNDFFDVVGEDSWGKITLILRKESRGMIEDDYASTTSFLLGLRTGRIDPGWTDLCLLTRALRINFIILHGYSVGEEISMVRLPMRVIARSPLNWNELQYSILMRTPDRTEPGRFTYNPIVGVRKEPNITGFKIRKNHLPGSFVKMLEKVAESGTMPRWTDPTLRKWTNVHFGIITRA